MEITMDPMVTTTPQIKEELAQKSCSLQIAQFHVVLINDDEHSYDYVIEMLNDLFGYDLNKSFKMARIVDSVGRVIVETTSRERAELKRDQIQTYGPDWRIPHCHKAMMAVLEPVD